MANTIPRQAAEHGEQNSFRQELPDNPAGAGPKRQANANLLGTRSGVPAVDWPGWRAPSTEAATRRPSILPDCGRTAREEWRHR